MEIRKTNDGSQTLFSSEFGETYHSGFGAVTESLHVFIEAGFEQTKADPVHIFEMGFGTGLNALLTLRHAAQKNIRVHYHAVEFYPVPAGVLAGFEVDPVLAGAFVKMHYAGWNQPVQIDPLFELTKYHQSLTEWQPDKMYHLVYFDAFSPESQPELWTEEIFGKMYGMLFPGGIITTYCAKGYVRRNLVSAGFKVERLPGPPGKREMLRGTKP